MTTYLTLAAMLAFVLFPVLIPATLHAVHAVRGWRPIAAPAAMTSFPRRISPRLALAGA